MLEHDPLSPSLSSCEKASSASHKPHLYVNDLIFLHEIKLAIYIKKNELGSDKARRKDAGFSDATVSCCVLEYTLLKISEPQVLHMYKGDINNAITVLAP